MLILFDLQAPSVHDMVKLRIDDGTFVALGPEWPTELNDKLWDQRDEFLIVLYKDDRITKEQLSRLEQLTKELAADAVGVTIKEETIGTPIRAPLIWRIACLEEGRTKGFASVQEFPFLQYTLLEKYEQIKHGRNWLQLIPGEYNIKQHPGYPGWSKPREEWNAIKEWVLSPSPSREAIIQEPLITVLLCHFQLGSYVFWAVQSVLRQWYSNWELLIIDDASGPLPGRRLPDLPSDPRIKIIYNKDNQGKSGCLNQGLSAARGEWFVELDADDWLAPDCLSVFVQNLKLHDNTVKPPAYYANHYEWVERWDRRLVFKGVVISPETLSPEVLIHTPVPVAPRFYRRTAVEQVGGWITTDRYGGRLYEDIRMLVQLSSRGRPIRMNHTLYHQRLRSTSVTHTNADCYTAWKKGLLNEVKHLLPGQVEP